MALKFFGVAVGLLFLALTLSSSGLFGDANSLAVAMFLGLIFGIPAAFLLLLALLATAAKPLRSANSGSNQYMQTGDTPGERYPASRSPA